MSYINDFLKKFEENSTHKIVRETFKFYYNKIINGASGKLSKQDIEVPNESKIARYEDLISENSELYNKLAVIKLNGGLGTSMGLKKAKSLLEIKNGNTFLDIICKQIIYLRKSSQTKIPLIFMNSFSTSSDTLNFLKKYPEIKNENLPPEFVQNKYPKIKRKDFSPLNLKIDKLNWNPPGHGDIYQSLEITGILDKLISQGYEYLFLSNSDNLGAVADLKILTYFAEQNLPFMMEVCQRTESDKKGGHLAQTKSGRLILRETAQCPNEEIEDFQDINKFRFFNTNNLWVNLKNLKAKMIEQNNIFDLPIILNPKEVNGIEVYQLETAMGAAISKFTDSKAIAVPRNRFAPVKKTNDILAIWSDAYILTDDFRIILNPDISVPPIISLDPKYFKTIEQLKERIKKIPSLKKVNSLEIVGDFFCENYMEFAGNIKISTDKSIKIGS
jgi:UDP-N-acetylglucosamine pyrophosphorylase